MIIWQVNWGELDSNHKLFVLAESCTSAGKSRKSRGVINWSYAKNREDGYYFYMEFIQ